MRANIPSSFSSSRMRSGNDFGQTAAFPLHAGVVLRLCNLQRGYHDDRFSFIPILWEVPLEPEQLRPFVSFRFLFGLRTA
jgi:hypothetical protein